VARGRRPPNARVRHIQRVRTNVGEAAPRLLERSTDIPERLDRLRVRITRADHLAAGVRRGRTDT